MRRFSQEFVDVREKEKKRGTRGLITMPHKISSSRQFELEEGASSPDGLGELDEAMTTAAFPTKEHLKELQEKITKEILSSKLEENEMKELQVGGNCLML